MRYPLRQIRQKSYFFQVAILTVLAGALLSNTIFASGFQLQEQNAALLGQAYAGRVAVAESAATEFDNPAGLTRLTHPQFVVSLVPALIHIETRGSSTFALAPLPTEFGKSSAGKNSLIPALYYAHPLNDRATVALGIWSPYGLVTEHSKGSYVRYSATRSKLEVIDISPALALRFNDKWSFGAAVNIEYADVDFNSQFPLVIFNAMLAGQDANVSNEADDWAVGWHAGVLFEPSDRTRVGFTFHSQVVHHFSGTSRFETDSIGSFKTHNLSVNLTLPAYASLGAYHELNSKWTVLGEVDFTNWSTVDVITLKNVASPIGPTVTNFVQKYHDTWRVSVGGNYHQTENIFWRAGLAYDQTPTRSRYRSVRLPDGDRIMTAIGAHWQVSEGVGVDFSYAHFFIQEGKMNTPTEIGSADTSADAFGLQLTVDII